MEQRPTSNVTKGLIISLVIILLSVIFYFGGTSMASWGQYTIYAVFIAGIIWSCTNYGKQLNGNVTFGNVFAHGFKVSAVVAILMVIFAVLFFIIFPEMKDKALEMAREKMKSNPQVTEASIDKAIEMYSKNFRVFMIASSLFGYVFIGLIASLIGAALTKKNPPSSFQNQSAINK